MAGGRMLKGLFVIVAVAAGGIGAATHSHELRDFYLAIYPTDPAKRQALEMCFTQDHQFNRLDANARASCYSHALLPAEMMAGFVPPSQPVVNAVDLRAAAAAGHMPKSDVRRTEELQNALHLPH